MAAIVKEANPCAAKVIFFGVLARLRVKISKMWPSECDRTIGHDINVLASSGYL